MRKVLCIENTNSTKTVSKLYSLPLNLIKVVIAFCFSNLAILNISLADGRGSGGGGDPMPIISNDVSSEEIKASAAKAKIILPGILRALENEFKGNHALSNFSYLPARVSYTRVSDALFKNFPDLIGIVSKPNSNIRQTENRRNNIISIEEYKHFLSMYKTIFTQDPAQNKIDIYTALDKAQFIFKDEDEKPCHSIKEGIKGAHSFTRNTSNGLRYFICFNLPRIKRKIDARSIDQIIFGLVAHEASHLAGVTLDTHSQAFLLQKMIMLDKSFYNKPEDMLNSLYELSTFGSSFNKHNNINKVMSRLIDSLKFADDETNSRQLMTNVCSTMSRHFLAVDHDAKVLLQASNYIDVLPYSTSSAASLILEMNNMLMMWCINENTANLKVRLEATLDNVPKSSKIESMNYFQRNFLFSDYRFLYHYSWNLLIESLLMNSLNTPFDVAPANRVISDKPSFKMFVKSLETLDALLCSIHKDLIRSDLYSINSPNVNCSKVLPRKKMQDITQLLGDGISHISIFKMKLSPNEIIVLKNPIDLLINFSYDCRGSSRVNYPYIGSWDNNGTVTEKTEAKSSTAHPSIILHNMLTPETDTLRDDLASNQISILGTCQNVFQLKSKEMFQ